MKKKETFIEDFEIKTTLPNGEVVEVARTSTLSTGQPNTLRSYLTNATAIFGKDSDATKFVQEMVDRDGIDDEVIAEESQFLYLLGEKHIGWLKEQ